jgi:hypothetical protein
MPRTEVAMTRRFFAMLAGLAAVTATAQSAEAAPTPFLGVWRIIETRVAPWAKPGESAFSPEEQRALVGSTVTYGKRAITARAPLGCAGPHYRWHDVAPDYLFQGTLTDPVNQARALGFGATIATLETGCEGLIDFHFVDGRTAMFALNNMIYTLKKR